MTAQWVRISDPWTVDSVISGRAEPSPSSVALEYIRLSMNSPVPWDHRRHQIIFTTASSVTCTDCQYRRVAASNPPMLLQFPLGVDRKIMH